MPVWPIQNGPVSAHAQQGKGLIVGFQPKGKLLEVGARLNPESEAAMDKFSLANEVEGVRIIVGFNVGETPTWSLDDLVTAVLAKRPGGATFLAQKGVWTVKDAKTGQVKTQPEDGGQVMVLNLPPYNVVRAQFFAEGRALAQHVRRVLEQDVVLYEEQINGLSKGIYQVTP